MSNNYLENIIEKIRDSIQKNRFYTAGSRLYDLTKYGIIVKNKLLVLLASELADVFRMCLRDYKLIIKENNKEEITTVIEPVLKLLDCLDQDIENLDETQKIQIFDLLTNIIYNAERIQDLSEELSESKMRVFKRFEEDFE